MANVESIHPDKMRRLLEADYPREVVSIVDDRRTKEGRLEACKYIARFLLLDDLGVEVDETIISDLIHVERDAAFGYMITRKTGIELAEVQSHATMLEISEIITPPHSKQASKLPTYFEEHLAENEGNIAFS